MTNIDLTNIDTDEITNSIVEIEWDMFQQVNNVGGKAGCQESPLTFAIMRSSQIICWPKEIRLSYLNDLITAKETGRNLLTEKYARMMEYTFPAEFAQIEAFLPEIDSETLELVDSLTSTLVSWAEKTYELYPSLGASGRPIYSSEDMYGTSFETYNKGELQTYSKETLQLLDAFFKDLKSQNRNLHMEVEAVTVKHYGFDSLKRADEAQKANQESHH